MTISPTNAPKSPISKSLPSFELPPFVAESVLVNGHLVRVEQLVPSLVSAFQMAIHELQASKEEVRTLKEQLERVNTEKQIALQALRKNEEELSASRLETASVKLKLRSVLHMCNKFLNVFEKRNLEMLLRAAERQ